MAYQSVYFFTDLPKEIIEVVHKDLEQHYDEQMKDARLHGDLLNKEKRNSKNTWIPTHHWIAGWLWHYVQKANKTNFLYDLSHIDGGSLQYARYAEGEYYGWHNDSSIEVHYKPTFEEVSSGGIINNDKFHNDKLNQKHELIRKLSFSLQLSDPDDYEGGNVQLLDDNNKIYVAPRQRGSIILFDSRTKHRVLKVTKGVRKSIVGWVVGPRWK